MQAPEPEIAPRLGMSSPPVRGTLIRLEAKGLPGAGAPDLVQTSVRKGLPGNDNDPGNAGVV